MICRSRVDLPQPEPPMMIMVSPFSTVKLMPFSTVRSPNLRDEIADFDDGFTHTA